MATGARQRRCASATRGSVPVDDTRRKLLIEAARRGEHLARVSRATDRIRVEHARDELAEPGLLPDLERTRSAGPWAASPVRCGKGSAFASIRYSCLRLAQQAFPALGRPAPRAHGLESDRPTKLAIPGLVDDSETASAELPNELEPSDDRAGSERRAPPRAAGRVVDEQLLEERG
jgi:hypothetical protein